MIRLAALAALLATPAGAATEGQCAALLARPGARAEAITLIGGACVFADPRYGEGAGRWRADRVSPSGDVEALPDAPPSRLTGGVTGFASDPEIAGHPGLECLLREQARPGPSLTSDLAGRGGTLRIDRLTLRTEDAGEVTLTARLSGRPEVWPVDPVPVATMRLDELEATVVFDGLFEAWAMVSPGRWLLDIARPAEPQVATLSSLGSDWLTALNGSPLSESAARARAFLADLPHPRGTLCLAVGGEGLTLRLAGRLLAAAVCPETIARLAEATEVDLTWDADAP